MVVAYTVGCASKPLWAILKPKIVTKITFLLDQNDVKDLVVDPDFQHLFLGLLGKLAKLAANSARENDGEIVDSTTAEVGSGSDRQDEGTDWSCRERMVPWTRARPGIGE